VPHQIVGNANSRFSEVTFLADVRGNLSVANVGLIPRMLIQLSQESQDIH
jgi:hypothetical protein